MAGKSPRMSFSYALQPCVDPQTGRPAPGRPPSHDSPSGHASSDRHFHVLSPWPAPRPNRNTSLYKQRRHDNSDGQKDNPFSSFSSISLQKSEFFIFSRYRNKITEKKRRSRPFQVTETPYGFKNQDKTYLCHSQLRISSRS